MDAKGFIQWHRDEYMVLGKNLIACILKVAGIWPEEFYECEDTLTLLKVTSTQTDPQWGQITKMITMNLTCGLVTLVMNK